ncbi:phosphoribosyltransferase [Vulgatibacter sp.]|uniref:phosphoribosyltransferase n=1 Tax=Vulgatibacter sp. TaxID=1971226 RepID=UPI003569B66F
MVGRQETRRGGTSASSKATTKRVGSAGKAKAVPERETAKARTRVDGAARTKARATPESETAKARTAAGGGTAAKKSAPRKAAPAAKAAAAKAPPVAAKKKAAAAPKAATTAKKSAGGKAAAAAKKPAKAAPAAKKPVAARAAPRVKKPAAAKASPAGKPAARGKAAAAKAGAAKPTRARKTDTPLAPEALPRIRRTVDRPASTRQRPTRAPRDRSALQEPGLRELDWQHMAETARTLARQVAKTWSPELVIGVAKGGVFAGEEVATTLGLDFYPVRVGKRSRDAGARAPAAAASMPAQARGKRVLVVDDIAGSGATLRAAVEAATAAGASEVRTATLVIRAGGFQPDFSCLETADLVVFPWDYEPSPGAVGSASTDAEDEEEAINALPFADDFEEEEAENDEDDIDQFGV